MSLSPDPRKELVHKIRDSLRALAKVPHDELLARHDRLVELEKAGKLGNLAAWQEFADIIFGRKQP